ncbi:hypothetical protein [Kitasatospora sp. NPDC085464]|uniref:hypothetical protein n=1 Tax=Kitasatospora sp. NPDC085464 TaxID=3364063 RepID=UPI0037C569F8
MFGETGFTAQVVSAATSASLPGIAPPLGRTTLLVRLKVASDPIDRTSKAPNHIIMAVKYPVCGPVPDCWHTEGGARALQQSDGKPDVCVPLGQVEPFHGQMDRADLESS